MKKVIVFLAEGFEEGESLFVIDILRRAGIDTETVSVTYISVQCKTTLSIDLPK